MGFSKQLFGVASMICASFIIVQYQLFNIRQTCFHQDRNNLKQVEEVGSDRSHLSTKSDGGYKDIDRPRPTSVPADATVKEVCIIH